MNIIKRLANYPFWMLSFLGIIVFILNLVIQDLPADIQYGIKGQKAIQLLDEIRRPILTIKNSEYLDKASTQAKHQSFKKTETLAHQLLADYLKAAAYNPILLQSVIHLETGLHSWLTLEQRYWSIRLSKSTALPGDMPADIQAIHHKSTQQFFQVLDILALGETPIHNDVDKGRSANIQLQISSALLIIYLFTLIIIFQKMRNKELHSHKEELEKKIQERTHHLEIKNRELEAFSYSVSHDLRSPLRSIDGFSLALLEDCNEQLDETGKNYLQRIRKASQRMGGLIDDILHLSHVSKSEINKQNIDLSSMAEKIIQELQQNHPDRIAEIHIDKNMLCNGDIQLIHIVITNLLSNAWKYSANKEKTIIEFGIYDRINMIFFIKDNGAGFDMQYVDKLFNVFHRLHGNEFEGNGIGLATVKRILDKHNGSIRAESKPDKGCSFYFSI